MQVLSSGFVGMDRVREEVSEIVSFIRNPEQYTRSGARVPKGCLLSGPSGTGKTLLAKHIAHEAGVPFLTSRDMDRVLDVSKCVLFVDIDNGEHTLRRVMSAMDSTSECMVIAATNRCDPVRHELFERHITLTLPDVRTREHILLKHSQNKVFDNTVDLVDIARHTCGYSGAALESLLNEAVIRAVRDNRSVVTVEDIHIVGFISEAQKKRMATHEASRVIFGLLTGAHIETVSIMHHIEWGTSDDADVIRVLAQYRTRLNTLVARLVQDETIDVQEATRIVFQENDIKNLIY